ncbi:glutamyl-tRNA(Gln) amidotransferase subunit D [Methanococcus maripaludis C5]|uniref:Glutamyl-tRNA(Gln) amidotransferase subunit D n=1 Tax=Methanococcus maripaludis (strain C5 / ATCC BAA-1333) TaxID=402880 RepID=GATD_METM5|nr:Glu-tRNA(Gln) amidotransferase subunit GatD [Methanococcus maripaludis]A4FWR5.1 RecName: Full=Glutamyl-tRNA(Gln) amidotransferase subunit D; Short=Glu-ADT subunit D [Methanococcus maripaludis C5]ABO34640.1 glutamyl-tRNA(Gln) amidotransferase subunit D [Methanococcus maripaludis C5]
MDIGDFVKLELENTTYSGTVMPSLNEDTVVIKMKSGYNVGLDKKKIKNIEILESGDKPKYGLPPLNLEKNPKLKNISILSTGGTVASRVDYKTGAVHPAFTADDLIRAVPELMDIANIKGKVILNILSENMLPAYWKMTADAIKEEIENGAEGIVIAHGTDTMHYTASALSFMVTSEVPIILVGAQRSSDRPSSDAALNIIAAVKAATEPIKGVYVLMHGETGDTVCHLHEGTKVRKLHSSRRDAFKSVNETPIAEINPFIKKVTYLRDVKSQDKSKIKEVVLNTDLEEKVALIKVYPGIDSEILKFYVDNGYKGIILEGTGLGHTPETFFEGIDYANENNVLVAMTTQTINGRVNMNVYSNGRELQAKGVIPCEDMLPEVAFVKLMHLLGNYGFEESKELMSKNIVGEINESINLEC